MTIDVSKMMAQKMKSVGGLTKGIEGLFKKNKVNHVVGFRSLVDKNTVEVTKEDGTKETFDEEYSFVTVGTSPKLNDVDLDEKTVVTSTGGVGVGKGAGKRWWSLEEESLVWNSAQFGRARSSESDCGEITKVIGGNMDNQIRTTFQRALKKQKIDFKMETAVKKAEKMPDGKIELTIEKVSTKKSRK